MAIVLTDLTNGTVNRTDPEKPVWEGTAVFDVLVKAVNENVQIQFESGRITGADYAKVYVNALQACMNQAMTFLLQKQVIEKDIELKAEQKALLTQQVLTEVQNTAIKTYENTVLQPDQHNIALKQIDKSTKEATMLTSQNAMIVAQTTEIAPNAAKQRAVQDGQISQMTAEVNYTNSKKTVMEESRIDNLALEALKAQMSNLATVGAGGLTPSTTDFSAANELRKAIYERARGTSLPTITFTAGTAYTKAT